MTPQAFTQMAKKLVDAAYATPRGKGKTRGLDPDQWVAVIAAGLTEAFVAGQAAERQWMLTEVVACQCGHSQPHHRGDHGACFSPNCPCVRFEKAVTP